MARVAPAQVNQSLVNGLACLQELVLADRPIGVRELARQLDMDPTRVSRLLGTLSWLGLASQDADRKYHPGPAVHVLSALSLHGSRLLADSLPVLREVAAETGLDRDAILTLLTAAPLTVLAVGFLPGFPFCGPVPDALALPRRKTPRLRVPPGSLAIANGFAGIYPWESPGGWRILGHCPLPLFDARRAAPALLAPGDALRLDPVDADEHARLRKGVAAGEIGPEAFLEDAA